ncbi:MAG: FGGY family carbohydrate kinase [Bacteroidota bacterium]
MKNTFLAISLGNDSVRTLLGELTDGNLNLREIHSFANVPLVVDGQSYWDIDLIFAEIKKCLAQVADSDIPVESIGITTSGMGFSLLFEDGSSTKPLFRFEGDTAELAEALTALMAADKIFGQTGVQLADGNTLLQVLDIKRSAFESLKKAKHFLFLPDIFNYLLTSVLQTEFSIAATSQLYNPVKRLWDRDVLRILSLPVAIMPRIAEPGSIIGSLTNNISYATGMARIPVVAVASDAIASAVSSIPATGNNWAYISIGDSIKMGFESATAIITKKSMQLNFTNAGGAGHMFHLHRNLVGFSLLQQCRDAWTENSYTPEELTTLATASKPFTAFIDTDHASFADAENLPAAIAAYCESTGQDIPQTQGEIIRTILEGLAFKFRVVAGQIEDLSGCKPGTIYITGEGIENELLCQFTADSCAVIVKTAAAEAGVAGNILVQAIALGIVKNVAELREIIGRSFPGKDFQSLEKKVWDKAFERYLQTVSPKT